MRPCHRVAGRAHGPRRGFTLIELLVVVVVLGVLAAIALASYRKAVLKAQIAAVATEGRSLYDGFQTFYVDNLMYPNASSNPTFQLNSFDPLRSQGYYDGEMAELLVGASADAYDSPDDEGPNQEFWVQLTLDADPRVHFIVASSNDAPLAGGQWLEGVFMFKDGELRGALENY